MKMRYLVIVLLTGAVLIICLHPGSFWQQSLDSLSPVPAGEQALYKSLRQDVGEADNTQSILITAPALESVLQASEALAPTLQAIQDRGGLKGFSSPAALLPSEAMQRARQAAIPDGDTLKRRWNKLHAGCPSGQDCLNRS